MVVSRFQTYSQSRAKSSVAGSWLVARRPQLLQALAEQIGGLGVVVDVVAEGGFEGELGRGVGPAADHLHQLDFEVAVVGQALRVLLDREAPAKLASIYDRHGKPPLQVEKSRSRVRGRSRETAGDSQ